MRLVRVSLHALERMDFGEKMVLCLVIFSLLYVLSAVVWAVVSAVG